MKRLLIVGNDADYFFSHRLSIAKAAEQAGYDVQIAIPFNDADVRIREEKFLFHKVSLNRGGMNLFQDLGTIYSLIDLYRKVRPDLIHHFTIKPVLYGGWAARIVGIRNTVNAMTGLGTVFSSAGLKMSVLKRLVIAGLRIACGGKNFYTVFQNDEDRDYFVEQSICQLSKTKVIRGSGVDIDEFCPGDSEPLEPLVIFPSRMLWDKGIKEFVEAARRLLGEGVSARFVLVGDTDPNPTSVDEAQLLDWQREGVIEWWGYRADMPEVLRNCQVVCMPSYHEGLPKSLVEAAACGRPIVTTNIPGCRDVVIDRVNGLLVKPKDVSALVEALRELLASRKMRVDYGRKGRELAARKFSSSIVIKETLELYESILE